MNRTDFVLALAAAGVARPREHTVGAQFTIARDDDALLSPFTVAIALRNGSTHIVSLAFPTVDAYRIDVYRDQTLVWSSATGHKPIPIARRIDVEPGVTRLASQVVDGTTDDHRAFAPGRYTVRVTMLGTTLTSVLERPLDLAAPVPIAAARTTTSHAAITIAGTPGIANGAPQLTDASGTIRLSRALGRRPAGDYVVRGTVTAIAGEPTVAVSRFAPAFDNTAAARPFTL